MRRMLLCGAALAGLAVGPAAAQQVAPDAGALAVLLQQASYWRGQQRIDLAERSLQRAEILAPDDPDVLALAAQMAADAGHTQEAEAALAKLRQRAPADPRLAALDQAVRIGPISDAALAEARRLAAAGKAAEAVAAYNRLFKSTSPPAALAVEYYQTLAGTEIGWQSARDGLAAVVRQTPQDARAQLAYAQVLTYRDATRQDGIARLTVLAQNPAVAAAATASWRQALLWLPDQPGQADLFAAFLTAHPGDAQVTARLDRAQHPVAAVDPGTAARTAGFAALEGARLDQAAGLFQQAIDADPQDADAIGGMGLVRLRQRDMAAAKVLLARAMTLDPEHQDRWRSALAATEAPPASPRAAEQARGQALRTQAEAERDPAAKLALYRAAIAADPQSPWLRLDLARLLLHQGQPDAARATMQAAIGAAPSVDALRAGAIFAQESGDADGAAALIARLPPAARTPEMRALAATATLKRDIAAARLLPPLAARTRLLALAASPDPVGARGALLAEALAAMGEHAAAREAVATAAAATPGQGAAARLRYAGALLGGGETAAAQAMLAGLDGAALSEAQRQSLTQLQAGLAVRDSDRLNKLGRQADAYDRLAPVLAAAPDSADLNLALSRLYQSARNPREALAIAQAVLRRDPQNAQARRQAVAAALAANDRATADTLVQEAEHLLPDDPQTWIMAADLDRARGRDGRALQDLERARSLRQQQLGSHAHSAGLADGLVADTAPESRVSFGALAADQGGDNPFRTSGQQQAEAGSPPGDAMTTEIDSSIATLRQQTAPSVQAGVGFRSRSGDSGLDRLDELSLPLVATFAPGGTGTLKLAVTPTILGGGTLGGYVTNAQRFGTGVFGLSHPAGASAPVLSGPGPTDQNAAGNALDVAYAVGDLSADVGTTPLGFREQTVVGGLEWAPKLSETMRLRLTADRRSVTDSVLSYAGAVDPRTGQAWGGVVRSGGHANLEGSAGPADLYIGGGWHQLTGTHVVSNTETEGGAGGSVKLWHTDSQDLRVGVDLVYFAYAKNTDYFTFGQGGYFSPQAYYAALLPVIYKEQVDPDFSYEVGAAPGLQSYHQNAAPYFPIDPALQSRLVAMQADPTTAVAGVQTMFPSMGESGFAGNAHAVLDYRIAPGLHLGARADFLHAGNFTELSGLAYARYIFGMD